MPVPHSVRFLHAARFGALLVTLLVLGAVDAQASLQPVAGVRVASELQLEYHARPGDRVRDTLVLANDGDAPALVRLAVGDFSIAPTGGLEMQAAGALPTSSAPWYTGLLQVEIPASGQVEVPFEYLVPIDAVSGSYWNAILVQPAGAVEDESGEAGPGVRTQVRIVTQFALTAVIHVGVDASAAPLGFVDPAFGLDDGRSSLSIGLQHEGRFIQTAASWLELYDDAGALVVRIEGGQARVYPDHVRYRTFDLGALTPGRYQAVVLADGGGDVAGVRFELDARSP